MALIANFGEISISIMSKFKGILKAAQDREKEKPPEEPVEKSAEKPKEKAEVKSDSSIEPSPPPQKRGRPRGKRSNPDYEQVTAYIKKKTYKETKIALLEQEELENFSELVEKLLSEWLSTQKPKNSDI
jgi:hypothetical protein